MPLPALSGAQIGRRPVRSASKPGSPAAASGVQLAYNCRMAFSTTSLMTDMYELTMVDAAIASGTAERKCVFEAFGRRLPGERRYGVVCGTGRLLEAIRDFRFNPEEIEYLASRAIVSDRTAEYLADYRFTGDVYGYAEGECYFPHSPVLTVTGSFAECVVLETVILSILNHDSAVATAASRMTAAAHGRPCLEFGARRTHETAAVHAARAAVIAGFTATSDLEGGRTYDLGVAGTSAHSFTLVHDSEKEAFAAQIATMGTGTTLLVDTYDITEGADGKMHEVAKSSKNKASVGGLKVAGRVCDQRGSAAQELVVSAGSWQEGLDYLERAGARPLQVKLVDAGAIDESRIGKAAIAAAAARHEESRAELPYDGWRLSSGEPAVPTKMLDIFEGDD